MVAPGLTRPVDPATETSQYVLSHQNDLLGQIFEAMTLLQKDDKRLVVYHARVALVVFLPHQQLRPACGELPDSCITGSRFYNNMRYPPGALESERGTCEGLRKSCQHRRPA
ncbi:hypothetical protein ANO14919_047830 [Xylariales sp. No.14919]|nr:hypothetical protein ANO14919_047830 [Xylariales sp. No.14919]